MRGIIAFLCASLVALPAWRVSAQPTSEEAPAPDDSSSGHAGEKPWSVGVTDDKKQSAQALLEEGNKLFLRGDYPKARDKYLQALDDWDHPAIRFNLVRTYIALEQPVEAYANLELSLKYGEAPLERQVYTEARSYEKLLKGQIAELSVTCEQEGVAVTIDGTPLLSCPGRKQIRLLQGKHQIVGKKKGLLTQTVDIVALPGGEVEQVKLNLRDLESSTIKRRRWAWWMPWSVVGGGVVLAGVGGLLKVKAHGDLDDFNAAFSEECGGTTQCTKSGQTYTSEQGIENAMDSAIVKGLLDDQDAALRNDKIAISMLVTGGVIAASGVVLAFLNRPQTVFVEESEPPNTTITPAVGGDQAGLILTTRF